jgi:urea-proton symporter
MLAGNVVSLLTPIIFIPVLSFVFKSPKYDWVSMKEIRRADDHDLADAAHVDLELVPGENHTAEQEEAEQKKLNRAAKISRSLTVFLTLALLILWPMPMYGSGYIFSKGFFTGWVSVGILWLFCSATCVGLYPLWEGRHTMYRTTVAIYKDITGKGKPVIHGRATVAEIADAEEKKDSKGLETPPEKVVASD